MALLPLAREGPKLPGLVAAMRRRLPGTSQGERGAGKAPNKHGLRRHHPWSPEGLVHLMSTLPHPLLSKQPLSHTQGTAGVREALRGQRVTPGTMSTEMPPGHEASPQSGG